MTLSVPVSPSSHQFRQCVLASVRHILNELAVSFDSLDAAIEQFPFLAAYQEQIPDEASLTEAGPIRRLCDAAELDQPALSLLMAAGLVEEDARFGFVFEAFQSPAGLQRPTLGLLEAWWRSADGCDHVRSRLRHLVDLGLLQVRNSEAPRLERAVEPTPAVWDALRGEIHAEPAPAMRYKPPESLVWRADLVVPLEARDILAHLPNRIAGCAIDALIVRGPSRNGRRTLVGAVARELGLGVLEVYSLDAWVTAGPLATLLNALPVLVLDLGPGESVDVAALPAYVGPVALVVGGQGGLSGTALERAIEIPLGMPDVQQRCDIWRQSLNSSELSDVTGPAETFHMTGGNIRRAAELARAHAALDGRAQVTLTDIQQASRSLNRQALDTLATRLPSGGHWGQLVVDGDTRDELRRLEARCRHRERLAGGVGAALADQISLGVRALFSGPSGTGKTLAARLLATSLQLDVYRLDLAAVVNKYIGETEKNLDRVFQRAEELGVVLLLDEGDALLTQRTVVQTSNDRYANLETNYLLQRLETFQGILLITSNASQRIDSAFQRRLDVVIEFRAPEAAERLAIWQVCLPANHAVEPGLLEDIARRCQLSGGAIRNAVLHAALLAVEDGGHVHSGHLAAAIQREYRKVGAVCPLRRVATV